MAEADAQNTKNNLLVSDSAALGCWGLKPQGGSHVLHELFLPRLRLWKQTACIAENHVHAKHSYILCGLDMFTLMPFFWCYARASWVPWSMHVRSWQRTKRAVLQGSHSPLLSSFTPTWLTWMGTSHRRTWTSSSAACRKKCRCQSSVTNKDISFHKKQAW